MQFKGSSSPEVASLTRPSTARTEQENTRGSERGRYWQRRNEKQSQCCSLYHQSRPPPTFRCLLLCHIFLPISLLPLFLLSPLSLFLFYLSLFLFPFLPFFHRFMTLFVLGIVTRVMNDITPALEYLGELFGKFIRYEGVTIKRVSLNPHKRHLPHLDLLIRKHQIL